MEYDKEPYADTEKDAEWFAASEYEAYIEDLEDEMEAEQEKALKERDEEEAREAFLESLEEYKIKEDIPF